MGQCSFHVWRTWNCRKNMVKYWVRRKLFNENLTIFIRPLSSLDSRSSPSKNPRMRVPIGGSTSGRQRQVLIRLNHRRRSGIDSGTELRGRSGNMYIRNRRGN
ncbi:unnamed protein product [Meganyctiphanes norvegica]|uniref:Ribosomal protein S19 n=1 Tax=Meganyctiphanes norvegica TaxID=48144 RepID=A0AAV2RKL1_MEGNR